MFLQWIYKPVQAGCLTILLVDELWRVGRGGFQPLQREKDYFIDSLLDNQYNTWEPKPQIWTKFGLIQMSHQQEVYFWPRRAPSHRGAASSLNTAKGADAPPRLQYPCKACDRQRPLPHLCAVHVGSLALFRTAAPVGVPLSLRVLAQHVLRLVHNVLELLDEHLFLQRQNEIVLHLKGATEKTSRYLRLP